MSYVARLVAITKVAATTKQILPFIHFQAQQKGLEITDETRVAILQVENIPSYHIVFIDTDINMEQLEAEMGKNDTILSRETRAMLLKHMKNGN
jgi:hypothetical protein